MKLHRAFIFIGLVLTARVPAGEPAALAAAQRALDEAIPQIAIQKLEAALSSGKLEPAHRERATLLLGEALLARGFHAEALAALAPLAETDDAAQLLRAHIFLAAGKWTDALVLYQRLASRPNPPVEARVGAAEALQALDRTPEAVQYLEAAEYEAPLATPARLRLASLYASLPKPKRARAILATTEPANVAEVSWKAYIEARLLLGEGRNEAALAQFEAILAKPEDSDGMGLPEGLLVGASLGAADARLTSRGVDDADRPLEGFISRHPESPWLELVFARLDQIYERQKSPTERKLQNWATPPSPRAALALIHLARMQIRKKGLEKAATTLETFVATYSSHPRVAEAHLMRSDLMIARRDFAGAIRALEAAERRAQDDDQRAEIQLRTGLVLYEQGQPLLAANEFARAGSRSPRIRENALFNAALAALQQKNYDRFLIEYRALSASFPGSPLRSDLILEQGLVQARQSDPQALETLDLLLTHFPLSPRQAEARLALSELAYARNETASASNYLLAANQSPGSDATAEHADYLAVFLAEAGSPEAAKTVVEKALSFIGRHPASPLLPEVRMKLGQVYYRAGDFPNAETQFVTLARGSPQSPYAEKALFLGGQAATQWLDKDAVRRALDLFREVVERKGALELHARQQQAIIQSRLQKEQDAIRLYDIILAGQPEAELRHAALAGKGDNLVALGRKDPAQLDAALAVFDQLSNSPDVPAAWRNQALYKKAHALEGLKREPEALAAYYEVLDTGGAETREFFWYYKAGFDAARLFEAKQDWAQAIGIYLKMARFDGPRAVEAKNRVKELRLKHFIWE